MKTNSMIEKNAELSAEIEDQVAAFLAKGGAVKQYEECSVEDANHKSRKMYKRMGKDGKISFVRVSKHHIYTSDIGPKVGFNHRGK